MFLVTAYAAFMKVDATELCVFQAGLYEVEPLMFSSRLTDPQSHGALLYSGPGFPHQ